MRCPVGAGKLVVVCWVTSMTVPASGFLGQGLFGISATIPRFPQSCDEYLAANPGSTDGNRTLYVRGDSSKPFTAYCSGMAATPKTYIPLVRTGGIVTSGNIVTAGYNYSACGKSSPVVTQFTRVAYDAAAVAIDPSDTTFSSSQGTAVNWCGIPLTFGVAQDCTTTNSSTGRGNVDLTGTGFGIASNTWTTSGFYPAGSATISGGNVVTITGGGYCGGTYPGPKIYLTWTGG